MNEKIGAMVSVFQNCPYCGDIRFSWRSQPLIFGKYPAGNVLLSFAMLMAGASISKLLMVFRHMGICNSYKDILCSPEQICISSDSPPFGKHIELL